MANLPVSPIVFDKSFLHATDPTSVTTTAAAAHSSRRHNGSLNSSSLFNDLDSSKLNFTNSRRSSNMLCSNR